jgi:1-acyl-sn-glycerol-3-phosphate acyltransferase
MRAAVGAWRLLRVLLHVLHGMAIVFVRFESYDAARRHARIRWWSAGLLQRMGASWSPTTSRGSTSRRSTR